MSTNTVDIRIRLLGARQSQRDADLVRRSVDRISGRFSVLRGVSMGLSGALGAIGEAAKYSAIGLGALAAGSAAAIGVMGSRYNQTLDSQRVSFTTFMRSAEQAEKFIGKLGKLAEESPVLDVESTGNAARMLMAYGLQVEDVLPMVKALGDMSAASGKSIAEVLPRASLALGQVVSKGRLQTQEMNQLAESVGLSRGAIRKALGMGRDEFEATFKPGKNISAKKALPAIRKAMVDQSSGAAKMLANTTQGEFDRLKEVFSRKSGELTRGLYDAVGDHFGNLAEKLGKLDVGKLIKGGKKWVSQFRESFSLGQKGENLGFLGGDAISLGNVAGRAFRLIGKAVEFAKAQWANFMEIIRPAQPFFDNVLGPLLKGFGIGVVGSVVLAFKALVNVSRVLFQVLGWIGQKAAPLKGVFQGVGIVLGWLLSGPVLKGIGLLGKLGGVFKIIAPVARAASVPIRLLGKAFGWAFGMVGKFIGGTAKIRQALTDKLLTFLIALPARFHSLGLRMAQKLVDAVVGGLKKLPGLLGKVFTSGLGFAGNVARGMANWLNENTPLGDEVDVGPISFRLPALANGGVLTNPGQVLVGERGPEVLTLPKAARVDPLPQRGPMAGVGAAALSDRPIVTQVFLDRRQIAEAVGRDTRDRVNRR